MCIRRPRKSYTNPCEGVVRCFRMAPMLRSVVLEKTRLQPTWLVQYLIQCSLYFVLLGLLSLQDRCQSQGEDAKQTAKKRRSDGKVAQWSGRLLA